MEADGKPHTSPSDAMILVLRHLWQLWGPSLEHWRLDVTDVPLRMGDLPPSEGPIASVARCDEVLQAAWFVWAVLPNV